MQELHDTPQPRPEGPPSEYELYEYRARTQVLRALNTEATGYENFMMLGYPRQCYLQMPPMPGMPVLPDGVYPVDYDDLSTLSEERANIIMASFNLNGPNNENTTASIMDKISMISGFMGVWMKEEFLEEYDKKQVVKEIKEMAASKSGKFTRVAT